MNDRDTRKLLRILEVMTEEITRIADILDSQREEQIDPHDIAIERAEISD